MWYTFMIIKSFSLYSLYFTVQKSLRVFVQTVSNSTSQRWMLITSHTEITVIYGKYGYFNLKLSSLGRSLKTKKRRLHWQWLLAVSQQQLLGDAWSMDVSEHQLTSCDVPVPWRAVYDTMEYSTAFMKIDILEDHQVCNQWYDWKDWNRIHRSFNRFYSSSIDHWPLHPVPSSSTSNLDSTYGTEVNLKK